MRNTILALCILLLAHSAYAQSTNEEQDNALARAALKSVLISNFLQYVEWPEADRSVFQIGVVQDQVLADQLQQMHLKEHPKHGRIEVNTLPNLSQADDMDMLVCSKSSGFSSNDLFSSISDQAVLLVTEGYPYNSTMINFVFDGTQLKYEINNSNLTVQGFKGNDLLYNLADEVSEEDWEALLKSAREALSEESNRRQALEAQNEEMLNDIRAMSDRMSSLSSQVRALEEKIDEEKRALAAIKAEAAQERQAFEAIQAQLSEKERALKQSESELEESKSALAQNEAQVAQAEAQLAEKTRKLRDANDEYNAVLTRMNRLTALLENQKLVNLILVAIGLLISALAVIAFINFQKQRKQAVIIAGQRDTLEEAHKELAIKNEEILDSITYARRIQQAILPPQRIVKNYLEESFILYRPKDIVAGDFYWMRTIDEKVIFTAADCTGHGVPGAIVSVVCSNALNRSVREFGLTSPEKILDKTLELVINRFNKNEEEVKDGMDIALCALNTTNNHLEFAGAHNPLWLVTKPGLHDELIDQGGDVVRTHQVDGKDDLLIEIKANKQPIGKASEVVPYTLHNIQLQKGDTIYLFSDGYPDQFGGPKGKKFKYRSFKDLLISINGESMSRQKDILERTFEDWKGDLDQVDDVCVIGVRV